MSRKLIGNIITVVVFLLAISLDIEHIELYFLFTFIALQALVILEVYIISRRNVPFEISLTKSNENITTKDFLLSLLVFIILYGGFFYLLGFFTIKYLIIFLSIGIFSYTIQFFISYKKPLPTFLINENDLFANTLFPRKYNLELLKSVTFDGFTENYTADFEDSKKVKFKQDDYLESELLSFIQFMKTKSNFDVLLSENININ